MARRGALELAVLGLLHDAPMHGYELRKRLNLLLGWTRVLSYGTLYPCLKSLGKAGYIVADSEQAPVGKRPRIVYKLTAEGKEHLAELLAQAGPSAWDDENFGVHFALFASTDVRTRVRILEGRRHRLEERLERLRDASVRSRERADAYTTELQRYGLEAVEREVKWLSDLIDAERSGRRPGVRQAGSARSSKSDRTNKNTSQR